MLRELMVPPITDDTDPVKRQQLRDLAIMNGTYKETTKSFGIDRGLARARGFRDVWSNRCSFAAASAPALPGFRCRMGTQLDGCKKKLFFLLDARSRFWSWTFKNVASSLGDGQGTPSQPCESAGGFFFFITLKPDVE